MTCLLLLTVATPGVCREWSSPADAEAVCSVSSPVELPATGVGQGCASMWLEVAENGRDYARERAQWLGEPHEVVVTSTGYATPLYDHDLGILSIPLDEPVNLFGGTHLVQFQEPLVAFEMSQSQAEVLISQYHAGSLSLRLVFGLATGSQPEMEICETTETGDILIAARLQTAELLQPVSSHSHCRMDMLRNVRSEVMFGPNAGGRVLGEIPLVEVTSISGDDTTPEVELTVLSALIEAALVDCYVEGLESNPVAQGAITVGLHYDTSGAIQDPEVERDYINNPILTSCTIRRLGTTTLWEDPDRADTQVHANLLFRR